MAQDSRVGMGRSPYNFIAQAPVRRLFGGNCRGLRTLEKVIKPLRVKLVWEQRNGFQSELCDSAQVRYPAKGEHGESLRTERRR